MKKKWLIGAGITLALVLSGCTDNDEKTKYEKEVVKVEESKDKSILGVNVFEKNWNAVADEYELKKVKDLGQGSVEVQESLEFIFIYDTLTTNTATFQAVWTDEMGEIEQSHNIVSALAKTLDKDIDKDGIKQWNELHDMVRKADLSTKQVVMRAIVIDGTHKATFLKREADPNKMETEDVYMIQVQKLNEQEQKEVAKQKNVKTDVKKTEQKSDK